MAIDHSQTYKGFGIRAFGHRNRLKVIFEELGNFGLVSGETFCDLGCSNGYITQMIQRNFKLGMAVGLDHELENLRFASNAYPEINFQIIDLNNVSRAEQTYDLVTCFETLEHVGNLDNAISNILSRIAPGGKCLISVPIEHGARGFIKFLTKKFVFRYSAEELSISDFKYLRILLGGGRISEARPQASGYGTHFGFDYRDVDDLLVANKANFTAFNKGMTRFYKIIK